MQIRPKKGNNVKKSRKNARNFQKSWQNTTEKREKHMKLDKKQIVEDLKLKSDKKYKTGLGYVPIPSSAPMHSEGSSKWLRQCGGSPQLRHSKGVLRDEAGLGQLRSNQGSLCFQRDIDDSISLSREEASKVLQVWKDGAAYVPILLREVEQEQRPWKRKSRSDRSGSWSLRRWGRACILRICPTFCLFWYQKDFFETGITSKTLDASLKNWFILDVVRVLSLDVITPLPRILIFRHFRPICQF